MPSLQRWLILATSDQPRVLRAWRGLLLVLLLVITWLALTAAPPPVAGLLWDKHNHLLAFASLGLTASLGMRQRHLAIAAGLLVYGGLIELLQALTPSRVGAWDDLLADAVGIGLGQWAAALLRRWAGHDRG